MDNKLSDFGQLFIESVRDNTLFVFESVLTGHMKSVSHQEMHKRIKEMSSENVQILKTMVYQMVDYALHNMLFMFEEHQDWVVSNKEKGVLNLNKLSDGLAGELYTSDGWISMFSKYATSEEE